MENKKSVVDAVIAVVLVILCAALGSPLVVYGLYWIAMGATSPKSGAANIDGVLVIVGMVPLVLGVVILCGLVPSFLYLKKSLGGKGNRLTLQEIALLILLVAIPAVWLGFPLNQQRLDRIAFEQLTQGFDQYNPTKEMIEVMDQRIKNEFRKHETLLLSVRCFLPSDKSANPEFLKNYYVETIGSENIKKVKWGITWFAVELTEGGYENLKKGKYLRSISFYDTYTYGRM